MKEFLLENPDFEEIIKKILDYEMSEKFQKMISEYPGLGWSWDEVGVNWHKIRKLSEMEIIRQVYKSNKYKLFRLNEPKKIKEFFENKDKILESMKEEREEIKEEILDIIINEIEENLIGNHYIKRISKKFLKSKKPIHLLLHGDPASGKTLIAEILSKYIPEPNCVFIAATDLSAAGLFEVLKENRPKYLIIDEIDKIKNKGDLDTLHLLLTEGKIRSTKCGKMSKWIKLKDTKVMGIANDITRLRDSIIDRFLVYKTQSPTRDDFIEICIKQIMKENPEFNEKMARYISEKIWSKNKRIRSAVQIARAEPEDYEEIDELINNLSL